MENPLESFIKLRVRFQECDALQMVWHGNYFKYFEEGREAFGREAGFSYLEVKKQGYATPIVKTSCEHLLPLHYGDEFILKTTLIPTAAAKLVFNYRILKKDQLVCTGNTTQVFTQDGKLVLVNPPFYADWKKKMDL